jgi:two-component system sensor histidine kinase/response regulator
MNEQASSTLAGDGDEVRTGFGARLAAVAQGGLAFLGASGSEASRSRLSDGGAAGKTALAQRARALFDEQSDNIYRRTDRLFAVLMMLQWMAGIAMAWCLSPLSWSGERSFTHWHVTAAVFGGGLLTLLPLYLVWACPGQRVTRQVIAVAQMAMSSLLIHLMGGRIETHFHVFGSLAFLAFYRDPMVLFSASAVVLLDHVLRGLYFPQSVFGVLSSEPWRWLEHTGWVVFEDIFLLISIVQSRREMWNLAERQASVEGINSQVEQMVVERTHELAFSEQRFRSLSASSPVGIFQMDQEGRWIYANERCSEITGLPPEALGEARWLDLIEREDEAALLARRDLERALLQRSRFGCELRLRSPQGRCAWVHLLFSPLGPQSEGSFVGTLSDVTARREADEALQRAHDELEQRVESRTHELAQANSVLEEARGEAEKARSRAEAAQAEAENANRAKSEFLSRMSHELRTPLNAILGFGQLLEIDDLSEDQHDNVRHILGGGRHLLSLINEVLDISRIESGSLSLSPEPVSLREAVSESLQLMQPLAVPRQVSLETEWDPALDSDGGPYVTADQQRLKQVLLNLFSNAVKYNRDGGSVRVRCVLGPIADSSDPAAARMVRLEVCDTGHGLSPDKMERLWQPFERLGAEHGSIEGTGIGLALSKRLVQMMKGRVGASSVEGQGSIFWIELPQAQNPVLAVPALEAGGVESESQPEAQHTVLYIEDNASNLELVRRILHKRGGCTLLSARDGASGLEEALSQSPDVVLLDLNLPVMDGLEVLQHLRASAKRGVPIIVISADATSGQIERLRSEGIFEYLTKPLNIPQFLRVLGKALDKASHDRQLVSASLLLEDCRPRSRSDKAPAFLL